MLAKRKDELTQLLQPIKRSLNQQRLVKYTIRYLSIGLAASLVILLLVRLVPIYYYREIACSILALAILAALVTVFYKRIDVRQAAAYADSQGLQEQVSTAWEFRHDDSALARLQREAALNSLRRNLHEIRSSITLWSYSKRQAMLLSCLVFAWGALFLSPNPVDEIIRLQLEEKKAISSIEKEIDKEIKETERNKQLHQVEQEKIANLLKQIKQNLKEQDRLSEKLRSLEDGKLELAKLQTAQQKKQEVLEQLKRRLAEEQALAEVAKALDSHDQQILMEAMEKLSQLVATLTKEEQEELAQLMEAIARQTEEEVSELDAEQLAAIAEQLKQAAELLRHGELPASFAELKQALVRAQEALAQGQQFNQHVSRALAALQQGQLSLAQANPSASGLATGLSQGSGNPGQTSMGQGTSVQGSSSATSGQGQGSTGAGQNDQGGSGLESGYGSGASAPGSGHGQGASAGSGGGNGSGAGSGVGSAQGARELVTVPIQRLDGASQPGDPVGGPLGEGPSETRWSNSGQVTAGTVRPYVEVFQEYEQIARESLERNEIPRDYEELVKQYFSELEPF